MKGHGITLNFFCPLALAVTSLIGAASSARADIVIAIDTAAQRMTVSVDGTKRWTWPVSTGTAGYRTPPGNYHALRTERHYASKEWDDAPMPFSIFFTKRGHAIHGSSQTRLLGRPASHGCVRLNAANAAQLFQLVRSRDLNATTVTVN
jgi:lipoprotein-anchoring transpeptidase ErfK/SrfK